MTPPFALTLAVSRHPNPSIADAASGPASPPGRHWPRPHETPPYATAAPGFDRPRALGGVSSGTLVLLLRRRVICSDGVGVHQARNQRNPPFAYALREPTARHRCHPRPDAPARRRASRQEPIARLRGHTSRPLCVSTFHGRTRGMPLATAVRWCPQPPGHLLTASSSHSELFSSIHYEVC